MTSLKTSIKTITYLSDIGCLEIQGASLSNYQCYGYRRLHAMLRHEGLRLSDYGGGTACRQP